MRSARRTNADRRVAQFWGAVWRRTYLDFMKIFRIDISSRQCGRWSIPISRRAGTSSQVRKRSTYVRGASIVTQVTAAEWPSSFKIRPIRRLVLGAAVRWDFQQGMAAVRIMATRSTRKMPCQPKHCEGTFGNPVRCSTDVLSAESPAEPLRRRIVLPFPNYVWIPFAIPARSGAVGCAF
jgi:hypothetical protein